MDDSAQISVIQNDDEYYMRYVIFLVENTRFRVPTQRFEEESDVFKAMFSLPRGPDAPSAEGKSDDHPIRLDGVQQRDFKALLKVLYPRSFGPLQLPTEEWISVLYLSTKWAIDSVRSFAIDTLYRILKGTPHKLISYGKEFDVEEWIFIGVELLVRRGKPMTEDDVSKLGIGEVLRITAIRECYRGSTLVVERGEKPRDGGLDSRIQVEYGLRSIPDWPSRPSAIPNV